MGREPARLWITLTTGPIGIVCRSPNRIERDAATDLAKTAADATTPEDVGAKLEALITAQVDRIEHEGETFAEGEAAREWVYNEGLLQLWDDRWRAFQEIFFRGRLTVPAAGESRPGSSERPGEAV